MAIASAKLAMPFSGTAHHCFARFWPKLLYCQKKNQEARIRNQDNVPKRKKSKGQTERRAGCMACGVG
jgi:hypothetical protein